MSHRGVPFSGRDRAGLSLIEVLATLVLVGIVLPVAMQGISVATSAGGVARRSAEAAALAEAKLNELVVTQEWNSGMLSGDFGEEWPDYTWKAETLDWLENPSGLDMSLVRLDVYVSWISRGEERSVTVSTLVYSGDTSTFTDSSESETSPPSGGGPAGGGGGMSGER